MSAFARLALARSVRLRWTMRQENSVLFALRDLRTLEDERRAGELRADEERRLAEDAKREDEEQRQREADAQRRREQDEREALALSLRETAGRNAVLESDVQKLRALVQAVQPAPPPHRSWLPLVFVIVAAVAAVALVAIVAHRPSVHERVVYVPAPTQAPVVSPSARAVAPAPIPSSSLEQHKAVRASPKPRKPLPRPAPKLPSVLDCDGRDPLCGTML